MGESGTGTDEETQPEPVLLAQPAEGTPDVVETDEALRAASDALAAGRGPIAVDTERASGYRYSQRAYLVQVRREGAGTVLVDPVALNDRIDPLIAALGDTEWVLHAASQDLPCLAELGLAPARLFDTELAGRLAGYERVALGTLVELLLGYRLEKGHGAADWSRRPLPQDWLDYAALDVELLVPLRDALEAELDSQGKLEWALEEFEALRVAPPPPPRAEPWRRTSGIHRVRSPRGLASVRALWETRDALARQRDIAPGRVLPDSSIVEAAVAAPDNETDLLKLPVFKGRSQRRIADTWLRALRAAAALPRAELPDPSPPHDGPPPPNRWADRDPAAAARLSAARAALTTVAEANRLPIENLLQPDLVRRTCWRPPETLNEDSVAEALRSGGAREWQIALTAQTLSTALSTALDGTS
ncbi:ribonuclease D [Actinophytocola xinjiangensis]|uniref:Ribonuclease D n=1 Tax=Actinophytocola xinjiangensis TaxID=485602 RepID=A0A7Z0WRN7_9PSEU|nr:HRDC domain-containing protein [Actinophytocola xinjiangensis]OLF12707.1 ribonuclease D [Actinophytocola xinjiangensis]